MEAGSAFADSIEVNEQRLCGNSLKLEACICLRLIFAEPVNPLLARRCFLSLNAREIGFGLASVNFPIARLCRADCFEGVRLQHLGPVGLKQRMAREHISRYDAAIDRRDYSH